MQAPFQIKKRYKVTLGVVLIFIGMGLTFPFLRPYFYLTFAKSPDEITHPLDQEETIMTRNGSEIKARGKIFIPSIKMAENMVEGVGRTELDYGIGHYPGLAWPGQKGNSAFTGHNFYGQSPLFSLLHRVRPDDPVIIHYQGKRYEYKITSTLITNPNELSRFRDPKLNQLTLITCYPPGYTTKRLIVIAKPDN